MPNNNNNNNNNRPRKALRVSAACDHCHKRRVKCCDSRDDPTRCRTCADFGLPCTYRRPRKRGRTSSELSARVVVVSSEDDRLRTSSPPPASSDAPSAQVPGPGLALSTPWRAFAQASAPLVARLMTIYHETAYPIFPFFDRLLVVQRLARVDQASSPGFFCSVMAASALASARVRDGATVLEPGRGDHLDVFSIPAETFYTAAQDVLRSCDFLQTQDFGLLRGCALLAIASIQDGKIDAMHHFVGVYFTLAAIHHWHDEANWPSGMLPAEQEERRRLYWSMYTLDVYSSIVWNSCPHFHEAHARVDYPTGSEGRPEDPGPDVDQSLHWIVGWNFTTDLYRILEHAVSKLRTRGSRFNFMQDEPRALSSHGASVLQRVQDRYDMLPAPFREQREATGVPDADIYGFQMANIQATLALLQIVLFSLDGNCDLNRKCTVARNVLRTFRQVPTPFLRAISTPLIYHLGGIGTILGSVVEGPLSETSYQQVRELLLDMASLLGSLEASLHRSAGTDRQLRALVDRIDEYMRTRPEEQPEPAQDVPPLAEACLQGGDGGSAQDELPPRFQLPDELLQDWTWPYDFSQAYPLLLFNDSTV